MKKRVLSMVLALSMMLTLFPASAFAAGDTGGGTSPDKATPQSVDTENAADLTSATTITAQDVAGSYYNYTISNGGTYELEGGDYGARYIVIDTTEPVILNIKGNITCKNCFLSVYGSNRDVTVNGGEFTVTANDQSSSNAVFYLGGQNNKLTINGGTFQNSGIVINAYYSNNDTLTVNGGNFISTSDNVVAVYGDGSDCSTFDIQNATLTAKAQCTGVVYLQADSYDVSLTNCTVTAEDSSTRAAIYVISGNNEDASSAHKLTLGGTTELLAPYGVYLRHDCDLTLKDSARIVNSNPQSSYSSGIFYQNGTDTSIFLEGGTIEGFNEGVEFLGRSTNAIVVKLGSIQFQNNVTDLYIPNEADGDADDATYKNIMLELEAGLSSPVNVTFYDSLKQCKFIVASANNADKIQYIKSTQGKFVLNADNTVSYVKVVKQNPADGAYTIQLNGEDVDYVPFIWEDCEGKTLTDLGLTPKKADDDTNDYGEATIHFYDIKTGISYVDPDFSKELPADTSLEADRYYVAVVETAGNEEYNRYIYEPSQAIIYITEPAPKQTPDPAAYAVTYDGSKQKSYAMPYSEVEEKGYKTLGDLPLGYEVNSAVDVSKYGKASLHYYKATQNKGTFVSSDLFSIDYDTEYQADADLTPGAIYYVVVETAGSDDYTAARYTENGMYILIGKPDPEAANYGVMLAGDGPLTADSSVPFGSSWRILAQGATGSGTGAVEKILYRKAESTTAVWSNEQPTVPGTYEIALKVAEGDKYASASALTCDDWRITINKGVLDSTAIATYFVFDGSNVSVSDEHADFADKVGEITTVYYDEHGDPVTDLDADGKPSEPGTYGVGFQTEGTDYYEAYNSNGPVGSWELTVLAAPTAENYKVTVNGTDITELSENVPFQESIQVEADVKPGKSAGSVIDDTLEYAIVIDGEPDFDNAIHSGVLAPATYQVRFKVAEDPQYRSDYVTDETWRFTVEKSEPTPSNFTYDPTTNAFTHLPLGVDAKDVTIQYYTENGELVEDKDVVKDANGKDVPRMAGTYQVGITVDETRFYKGATFTGAETGWTYEKEPNFVTSLNFEIVSQPKSEIEYTGQPVTALEVKPNDNISPVNYKVTYYNETTQETTTEPPTDAGSYSWWVSWEADDNTRNSGSFNGTFTITEKTELDNTAVTVTVPEMREGADNSDNSFEVTVSSNDETLSTDDLEITYYDENGNELAEAPITEGTYSYSIKVKADATTTNFQPGATLTDENGNTKFAYTIKPAAYTADTSYGDVDYAGKADGEPLTAGTEVTVTAPADTDTSAFRQWIITVDGEEIDATVDGLAKLGVNVEDDAAALELLQKSPFAFTMPNGDVKISALTSNPQQEAFEQAAGTALIVGGAAAATGAVYYFGTTAYIRSQLPEGMAVPQNREQLAVALWTLAGKPATESTTVFTDVAADSEALPAIRWAVETGVMNANTTKDGTSFYAGNYVTRAETAYRIYKLQQQRAE